MIATMRRQSAKSTGVRGCAWLTSTRIPCWSARRVVARVPYSVPAKVAFTRSITSYHCKMLERPDPPGLMSRVSGRRTALLLIVALSVIRADPKILHTITLKAWREERRRAKEVRRRRDLETPLYVDPGPTDSRNTPALEKKMVDLVSAFSRLISSPVYPAPRRLADPAGTAQRAAVPGAHQTHLAKDIRPAPVSFPASASRRETWGE